MMYFCFRVLYFIKYKKTITFLITSSMLVEPGLYFLYFCEVWGVCSMPTDVNSKCTCMYLPVQYCSILLQGTIVLCKNVKCNQGLLYARKRHSSASSGNRATRTFRLSSIQCHGFTRVERPAYRARHGSSNERNNQGKLGSSRYGRISQ